MEFDEILILCNLAEFWEICRNSVKFGGILQKFGEIGRIRRNLAELSGIWRN